ncbi:MAG TPA: hypothetical protein VJP87_09160, partial [Candidatus Acidoferrales bacterium]|nr:hypothetical protein [Candidatus Acidoferrales bacterium]
MTTLSNQVIPCSPDEWKFVETPIGNCPDAQAARHAEEQLRAVFPQENNCGAAIRVRGGCAVKTDLGGLHTINGSDGTAEFQIVLLDGSEVKAAAPMT